MARKKLDTCRYCGDVSTLDSNWKPTGSCAACVAPPVKAARSQRSAESREDRETVTRVEPLYREDFRYVQTYRGEVVVNDAGEPM